MISEEIEAEPAGHREECRGDEPIGPAAEEDTAQEFGLAALHIFGHETEHHGLEAEAGDAAENDRADPDHDEDAVLKVAHPSRQQDLAGEREHGAGDAHQKNLAGEQLRQPAVAHFGEEGLDARDEARRRPWRGRDIFGTDQRHGFSLHRRRRPGCKQRQSHRGLVARNR